MVSVFVSGSFRNHYDSLKRRINEFQSAGFVVVSPMSPMEVPAIDFALLRGKDHYTDMARIIRKVDANETALAIRQSDVLFVHNPTGEIEPSSALHFGLAFGYGKPIFAEKEIEGNVLHGYFKGKTPGEIKGIIAKKRA
ncbi:MAG: hypothetical protein KGI06_00795 [Candidatus Micrarchaeota archaeon]|nr:hypothetical protein [Candidatus Micrarchaeota archaeon]